MPRKTTTGYICQCLKDSLSQLPAISQRLPTMPKRMPKKRSYCVHLWMSEHS